MRNRKNNITQHIRPSLVGFGPGLEPGASRNAVGVDRVAARYDAETPNGFRFQLINGDITPPRPYATVKVFAHHGGYEFAFKANESASELEQRSVSFIAASPACGAILEELARRAIQSAPDPTNVAARMLRMDCGTPYPLQLQSKYEGTEDGGATFVISIWNAATTPPKRIATIHVETQRGVNRVVFDNNVNGTEQTAVMELRNPDLMLRALSHHLLPHHGETTSDC